MVYEDDHLIVIDKPAGLVVHPAPGHASGTLVNALIRHCGASLSGIGGVKRPGIVHRLDKDTSGLLVVAKTDRRIGASPTSSPTMAAPARLTETIWRSSGAPSSDRRKVVAPMGRDRPQSGPNGVKSDQRGGRHDTLPSQEGFGLASLVECRLETGRTHQIRVHMASIGHPLFGDSVYGSGFKTKAARLGDAARSALAALGRQALHASVLGFEHPATGAALRFESSTAERFFETGQCTTSYAGSLTSL